MHALDAINALRDRNTSLDHLAKVFRPEWQRARSDVAAIVRSQRLDELASLAQIGKQRYESWLASKSITPEEIGLAACARMSFLLIDDYSRRLANDGQLAKPTRLSRWDLFWAQRLFFTNDLRRRTPSRRLFSLGWTFVVNKRGVLALVQQQGIYCGFSKEFCRRIASLAGGREVLELGAGDGTLAIGLEQYGAHIRACDDQSWKHRVTYPKWIEKLSAEQALRRYLPSFVVCSWPPPRNDFERQIFATESVHTYVAIVSKHKFAAGDWDAYGSCGDQFEMVVDQALSDLLVPREFDAQVVVFTRRQKGSEAPS